MHKEGNQNNSRHDGLNNVNRLMVELSYRNSIDKFYNLIHSDKNKIELNLTLNGAIRKITESFIRSAFKCPVANVKKVGIGDDNERDADVACTNIVCAKFRKLFRWFNQIVLMGKFGEIINANHV